MRIATHSNHASEHISRLHSIYSTSMNLITAIPAPTKCFRKELESNTQFASTDRPFRKLQQINLVINQTLRFFPIG